MKKLIAGGLLAMATTTTLGLAAPTAEAADTPGCVSQKEFKQVKKGMSKKAVARIFDTKGKREVISKGGGYTFEIRSYKTCAQFGAVSIGFSNGKLDNKSGIF